MKFRILFFMVPFFLNSLIYAENIRLLSFTVGGYANKNHRIENSKWVTTVSTIMKNSKADIILLQKFPAKDSVEIKTFLEKLGNNN